ncbi:MAG: gliding motility-associated protein GldE [Cyclobacteriaceae bacterium]
MEALEDPYPSWVLLSTLSSLPLSFYLVNGLTVVVLLILSGIVSGSEVAFFSLSTEQVDSCSTSEKKVDHKIFGLIGRPRKLLATILILNNLINIFIVTISTYATWQVMNGKKDGLIIAALTASITILIIFFGEILPKVFATQNNLKFAQKTAGFIHFFNQILTPLSWLLLHTGRGLEKRIQRRGYNLSVTEINHALEIATDEQVTADQKDILKGIVNFGTLTVKQVMNTRMDITSIDVETDFHELMNQINKTGYSRIPVYKETLDKIEGILYTKDLLPHIEKEDDFVWSTLLRPPFFVPETKKIDDLLKDFQERRVHMAIVVDEYGGTEGLITMEDVIEEIVGEINDEFDDDGDVRYNKLDHQTYIFEGKTSLMDFCKITGVDFQDFESVKGESESLGGLILEINAKLPSAGEKIIFENYMFTITAVDQKRIKKVRVYISSKTDD